jgi:hypothetical protein
MMAGVLEGREVDRRYQPLAVPLRILLLSIVN